MSLSVVGVLSNFAGKYLSVYAERNKRGGTAKRGPLLEGVVLSTHGKTPSGRGG